MPEILAEITEETLLCGDLAECWNVQVPPAARLASPASSLRRASFLAEIAWLIYLAGEAKDPAEIEAFYLGTAT